MYSSVSDSICHPFKSQKLYRNTVRFIVHKMHMVIQNTIWNGDVEIQNTLQNACGTVCGIVVIYSCLVKSTDISQKPSAKGS